MKREVYLVVLLISIYLVSAIEIPIDLIEGGKNIRISSRDSINFRYSGFKQRFTVKDMQEDHVTLTLENLERSQPKKDVSLVVNDIREVDIDNDNKPDLAIGLTTVEKKIAVFNINQILKEPIAKEIKPGNGKKAEEKPAPNEDIEKLNQMLKTVNNPYVFNALTVMNGQATLYEVGKSIATSKIIETITKDNPEAQLMVNFYDVGKKYLGVFQPASGKKPYSSRQQQGYGQSSVQSATGKAVYNPAIPDFLMAAWDGKDIYLNFKVVSDKNFDLSFMYKNGSFFAKNVDIFKDFSDLTISLNSMDDSSVIINEDVFTNVRGDIELMKDEVKINRIDLVSLKDNNRLHISGENPFYVTLNRDGHVYYDGKILDVSNGMIEFENSAHTINFGKKIKADRVSIQIPRKMKFLTIPKGNFDVGATSDRIGRTILHIVGSGMFSVDDLRVKAENFDTILTGNLDVSMDGLGFISNDKTEYYRGNKVTVKKLVSILE